MSYGILEARDFELYLTLSEKAAHDEALRSNDAFVLAMAKAVRKGRERVKLGTYVDTSPPIGANRIQGEAFFSNCGSPAAMCAERGGAPSGTESMK